MIYKGLRERKEWKKKGGEKEKKIIEVEGYMEVIEIEKEGINNVVDKIGNDMKEEKIEIIWRIRKEKIICFEGEGDGISEEYSDEDIGMNVLKKGK